METKHTPGPWARDKYGHVIGKDGRDIDFRSLSILCSGEPERLSEAEANTTLAAASPELLKALQWALPLARLAMEAHRMDRLRCGHNDIVGKYKSGQTWAGIYQSEVDEIEFACDAITKATT